MSRKTCYNDRIDKREKREAMDYTVEEKEVFMREALKEAEIALEHDEIPIGCVIVKDGEIIGRGAQCT